MNIIRCDLSSSWWWKNSKTNSLPVGICWHDTDAGNTSIKRYVQPADNDPNREELLKILGKNQYNNDWNHATRKAGVNAFIGKLADGSIATCQTSGFTRAPIAAGTAANSVGSVDGYLLKGGSEVWDGRHWVQFEICDDYGADNSKPTKEYFDKIYKEAVEFTAYICKLYNLDPYGTVTYAGRKVPVITCHQDAYQKKLACDHDDVLRWFKMYGKTMDNVRDDVNNILKSQKKTYVVEIGDFETIAEARQMELALSILGTKANVIEKSK